MVYIVEVDNLSPKHKYNSSKSYGEQKMLEKTTQKLTDKLTRNTKFNGLEKEEVKYGMYIFLDTTIKFIVSVFLAVYFNVLQETVIIIFCMGVLKLHIGGVHLQNYYVCFISTLLLYIGVPILYKYNLSNYIEVTNLILISLNPVLIFLVSKYAPSDTKKKPIKYKERRKKLRKKSLIVMSALFLISLFVNNEMKIFILYSEVLVVIGILPITYKILKEEKVNYEIKKDC